MAHSPADTRSIDVRATAPRAIALQVSRAQGARELLAAAVWVTLGGYLFGAGLHTPMRPLLMWGGALPITWGLTRAVFGLWHLFSAARRGS